MRYACKHVCIHFLGLINFPLNILECFLNVFQIKGDCSQWVNGDGSLRGNTPLSTCMIAAHTSSLCKQSMVFVSCKDVQKNVIMTTPLAGRQPPIEGTENQGTDAQHACVHMDEFIAKSVRGNFLHFHDGPRGSYETLAIHPREEYHVKCGLNFVVQCKQAMMAGRLTYCFPSNMANMSTRLVLAAPIHVTNSLSIFGSNASKTTLVVLHKGIFDMKDGAHSLTLGNVDLVMPSVRMWNRSLALDRKYDSKKNKDQSHWSLVSAMEGGRLNLMSCKVSMDDCGSSEKFLMSSLDEDGMRPEHGRDGMMVHLNDVVVDLRHVPCKKNRSGLPRWFLMSMPGTAVLSGEVTGVASTSAHAVPRARKSSSKTGETGAESEGDCDGDGGGEGEGDGEQTQQMQEAARVEWFWI